MNIFGPTYRAHMGLLKNYSSSIIKRQIGQFKNKKNIWRDISSTKTQQWPKNKRCSISQENANQNHNEIPLHTPGVARIKKRKIKISVGEDVKKLESSERQWWEHKIVQWFENTLVVPQMIKHRILPCDPAIPLSGMYQRNELICSHKSLDMNIYNSIIPNGPKQNYSNVHQLRNA